MTQFTFRLIDRICFKTPPQVHAILGREHDEHILINLRKLLNIDWTFYYFDKPPFQIISLEVFVHRIFFNTTTLNIKECYRSLWPSSVTQIKQHKHLQCVHVLNIFVSPLLSYLFDVMQTYFENYDVPRFCKGYRKNSKHNLYIGIIFAQSELTKNHWITKCKSVYII